MHYIRTLQALTIFYGYYNLRGGGVGVGVRTKWKCVRGGWFMLHNVHTYVKISYLNGLNK